MKKIALCGLIIVLCSGCGRGWLPKRGGPCGTNCGRPLPAPPAAGPCSTCGPATASRSYGAYDESIVDGDYYGGEVVGSEYYPGVISNGTVVENAPSMVPTDPPVAP